jgi:hypothetical protein
MHVSVGAERDGASEKKITPDAVPKATDDGLTHRTQLLGPRADIDSAERVKVEMTGARYTRESRIVMEE